MKRVVSWLIGLLVLIIRVSCRARAHNDPRSWLRNQGTPYVYAALHAHHFGALLLAEPGTWAMVSRSGDGEILLPALRISGVTAIRGSGGETRKGGFRALREMIQQLDAEHPAFLAVDGPSGPRGHVHEGIGLLAKKTGAAVLPVVVIPNRRQIMTKSWDRLQLPMPFSTIEFYFGEPAIQGDRESLAEFAQRIAAELDALEKRHDLREALRAGRNEAAETAVRAAA